MLRILRPRVVRVPLPYASAPAVTLAVAFALLAVLSSAVARPAGAQGVAIAPQVIVVDGRTRTASITLVNQGDTPSEISLSTTYGYPVTDANGTMTLRTFDTVSDTTPSAAEWVQFFPKRLRLPPQSRRTIRLLVTPPDSIAAREYWGRLIVSARGGNVSVRDVSGNEGISVGLTLEVRSVLPLFFRVGHVTTGLQIAHPRATAAGDTLFARAELKRTGTAAFLGTLRVAVRDASGTVVRSGTLPVGVYYTLDPAVPVSIAGLPAGTYQLLFEAVAERADVASNLIVPSAPARAVASVVIP